MPSKVMKEFRNFSAEELATKIRETEASVFALKMQKVTGQLGNTAQPWKVRKDLARLKGIATEMARNAKAAPAPSAPKK